MAFLLPLVVVAILAVSLVWGLLFLVSRYLHPLLALACGGLVIVYVLQGMVRGMIFCAEEPLYIPPSETEAAAGAMGRMIHNCDGPGGMLDYMYLYVVAPLMIVAVGVLTWRYGKREMANG